MANGLIDLQTDLTSLRYSTMPLGSDAPYVTKNIGQAPGSQAGIEIQARIDDTSRIAQMLVSKPGIKYLLHEAELQQISAGEKIRKAQQGGKTLVGAVLQQIGKTVVNTLKIAGSTLAQIPVNGTGTHFIKGFRTDTYLQPTNGNPASGFAQFFGAGGIEGAQYALRGEIVPGTVSKDNQNFGQTSNITGKFTPTPSLYDYNAKVNTDNNEVQNTPIPEWASKAFYNSTLASRGKVIPVSKTEIRPVQATNADTGEATTLPGFTTPFQATPKVETTLTPGILGITNQTTDSTPQYQNPSIFTYEEPGLFKEVKKEQTYYATQSANTQEVFDTPLRDTTAFPGTLSPSKEISEDNPIYVHPSTSTTEDLIPGIPTLYTEEGKYYSKVAKNHQETWGEPLKDSTLNFTNPGRTSEISGSDPAYLHPSVVTNKYLGFSEAGPVPDQSLFADGKLDTYIVDASKKNQDTWGDVLQDTTAPEGTIGRVKDRVPEVDSVPRFLPHIVDEKFDSPGPPPTYDPADTYLTFKRKIPTFNKNVLKESRVGLGDQGGRNDTNKLTNQYWTTSPTGLEVDSVNALDISKLNARQDATKEARDLAKLYFEIITPDGSKFIHFRAFIDSVDDNYNADWQGNKYVGRAEDFYTYGGFSRDINISFKIVAATRSELKPLYRKMVYLASSTAPTYGSVGGFMRGTLARMTVGSYFDQIPGVITSVKYSLIDELPWEINMLGPEGLEKGAQEVPTGLQCSVSFKPIHDFAPQTGLHHYFTSKEKEKTFFDEEVYTAVTPPARKIETATPKTPDTPPKVSREEIIKKDKEKTMKEAEKPADNTRVNVVNKNKVEKQVKEIQKQEAKKNKVPGKKMTDEELQAKLNQIKKDYKFTKK
jgi:hypothetical protein